MANPALVDSRVQGIVADPMSGSRMTRAGVVGSLSLFGAIVLVAGVVGWSEISRNLHSSSAALMMWGPLIVAMILGWVIMAFPRLAKWLGGLYALCEGFVLGAISSFYNAQYHGIVVEALGCTLGVALSVWFLYATGIIKVTNKVYRVVWMATIGSMLFYGVSLLIMLFGGPNLDGSASPLGIGISLVLAGVAAANLLVDFDRVDKLIDQGAGAEYDWYMAFAMLVSLIWLYLEILNILSKLQRR